MVLVHGYGGSGEYLVPTARHLALHFPTYVPDLPGYGRSGHSHLRLDAPELAYLLATWMGSVGLEQAVLIGNSFGCQVIAHIAARSPRLVSHLVLTSPTLDPRARRLPKLLRRFVSDIPREPLSLVPKITVSFMASGPRTLLATLRYMRDDDLLDTLAHVHVPGLAVCGAHDPLAPPDWCEQVAERLDGGKLVVIAGGAHALPFSQPRALAQCIREFMHGGDGVDASSAPSGGESERRGV
jgi:pimeloyl-ACP methyl ester carboxylesterase